MSASSSMTARPRSTTPFTMSPNRCWANCRSSSIVTGCASVTVLTSLGCHATSSARAGARADAVEFGGGPDEQAAVGDRGRGECEFVERVLSYHHELTPCLDHIGRPVLVQGKDLAVVRPRRG